MLLDLLADPLDLLGRVDGAAGAGRGRAVDGLVLHRCRGLQHVRGRLPLVLLLLLLLLLLLVLIHGV